MFFFFSSPCTCPVQCHRISARRQKSEMLPESPFDAYNGGWRRTGKQSPLLEGSGGKQRRRPTSKGRPEQRGVVEGGRRRAPHCTRNLRSWTRRCSDVRFPAKTPGEATTTTRPTAWEGVQKAENARGSSRVVPDCTCGKRQRPFFFIIIIHTERILRFPRSWTAADSIVSLGANLSV